MTIVGVVGLGTMGSRIAARLLDAGYDVHGSNRTADKAQALIGRGLRWHDTPRSVANGVEVVISMVTDDSALAAVTGGPDGIVAGLSPGQIYVDMSSVSPSESLAVAARVRTVDARMLDAPVSGSVPDVEQGTLSIMVGGDVDAFDQVRSILAELGQPVTRVGGHGSGVLLKLAINISLAVQTLAFSEGLLLAESGGISPALAAEVMSSSPIGSPMLRKRVPLLLDLPQQAWFDILLMDKDIRLALKEAGRLGVRLPSASAAADVLQQARDLGYGERDIAAFHEVLGKVSGRSSAGHEAASA